MQSGIFSPSGFLTEVIDLNGLRGCVYFEPYAGGAGAALNLLNAGVVSDICINDADMRIYAFWHAVLHHSDRFALRVEEVPLTVSEWRRAFCVAEAASEAGWSDTGFSAGMLFDRCRLVERCSEPPETSMSKIREWTLEAKRAVPDSDGLKHPSGERSLI